MVTATISHLPKFHIQAGAVGRIALTGLKGLFGWLSQHRAVKQWIKPQYLLFAHNLSHFASMVPLY